MCLFKKQFQLSRRLISKMPLKIGIFFPHKDVSNFKKHWTRTKRLQCRISMCGGQCAQNHVELCPLFHMNAFQTLSWQDDWKLHARTETETSYLLMRTRPLRGLRWQSGWLQRQSQFVARYSMLIGVRSFRCSSVIVMPSLFWTYLSLLNYYLSPLLLLIMSTG